MFEEYSEEHKRMLRENAKMLTEKIGNGAEVYAVNIEGNCYAPTKKKPFHRLSIALTEKAFNGRLLDLIDGKRFALVIFDAEKKGE